MEKHKHKIMELKNIIKNESATNKQGKHENNLKVMRKISDSPYPSPPPK